MAKKTPRAHRRPAARSSPGGPGGMAALKRAQQKLKELGIKLYKHTPEKPKGAAAAVEPAAATKGAPSKEAASVPASKPASKAAPARTAAQKPRAKAADKPRRAS